MATSSLRFEDRLDGASKFLSWHVRVTFSLKEHGLWEILEKFVLVLIDATLKEVHDKKDIKAQRMIMDVVKDHLIHHLAAKPMTREMFKALVDFFQSDNMNMRMIFRNKLKSKMSRFDNVTNYFMSIT